jgi:superfamily II DNA or RNA helicase
MFRTGLADVLVCCRALDEGIDVPEAECAILSASTSSHRQRVQRLGRVLRLSKDKELAHIYTVYVSESERDKLIKETSRLEGVAETSWMEMSR